MNTKERIMFWLRNPSGIGSVAVNFASKYFHTPVIAYPYVLQINLDTICNLHCFFCANVGCRDKPKQFEVAILINLKEAIEKATYISIAAFGEPLCSPNFNSVLDTIHRWNPRARIGLVTNGTKLSPELAGRLNGCLGDLTISLNAASYQTYERDVKGGDWNETTGTILNFMKYLERKHRDKVSLHFVAHKNNYKELPTFLSVAYLLNVKRVAVDQFTVNTYENLPLSLLNIKEKYNSAVAEAQKEAKRFNISFTARTFGTEKTGLSCYFPWTATFIWADGRVAPCCANGNFFLGNIYETRFEDIWFGEKYQQFRKYGAWCCQTCPMTLPFDNPKAHYSPYLNEAILK